MCSSGVLLHTVSHGHAVRDETLPGVRHLRSAARPPLLHDGNLHHAALDEALHDWKHLRLSGLLRQRRHLPLGLSDAPDSRVPGTGGSRILSVGRHQLLQAGVRVRDQHGAVQRRDHSRLHTAPDCVRLDGSSALLRPRGPSQECRA